MNTLTQHLIEPLRQLGFDLNSDSTLATPEMVTQVLTFTRTEPSDRPLNYKIRSIIEELQDDQQPHIQYSYSHNHLWVMIPGLP